MSYSRQAPLVSLAPGLCLEALIYLALCGRFQGSFLLAFLARSVGFLGDPSRPSSTREHVFRSRN